LFLLLGSLAFLLARRSLAAGIALAAAGLLVAVGVALAIRAYVPPTRPDVQNQRKGKTFWTESGAPPAAVMRMPVTFPPEPFEQGRMLAGRGVPDLSGRIGKPFYFTSDPFFTPREGNDFSIELVRLESNVGTQTTKITGPPGKPFGRPGSIELPLTLTVPASRDRLSISVGGEPRVLSPGAWSDWVSLTFRVNPLISIHGYGRFRLDRVNPEIGLYLSPIQFDPARLPPGFALSTPRRFARELLGRFGRYKTMGWAIDTWSIESGTLSEQAFLEDVAATVDSDRRMLMS